MKFKLIYFTVILSLATVSGCQQQDDDVLTQRAQTIESSAAPRQQAFIDPETGELIPRPTTSDGPKAAPPPPTDPTLDGLETSVSPDGTSRIRLDDRFNKQLMATKDCDGQLQIGHQDKANTVSSKCVESQEGEK